MSEHYDGSINIRTKVDNSGIHAGLTKTAKEINRLTDDFNRQVSSIRKQEAALAKMGREFQQIASGEKTPASLAAMESQLGRINKDLETLRATQKDLVADRDGLIRMTEYGLVTPEKSAPEIKKLDSELASIFKEMQPLINKSTELAAKMESIKLDPSLANEALNLKDKIVFSETALESAKVKANELKDALAKAYSIDTEPVAKVIRNIESELERVSSGIQLQKDEFQAAAAVFNQAEAALLEANQAGDAAAESLARINLEKASKDIDRIDAKTKALHYSALKLKQAFDYITLDPANADITNKMQAEISGVTFMLDDAAESAKALSGEINDAFDVGKAPISADEIQEVDNRIQQLTVQAKSGASAIQSLFSGIYSLFSKAGHGILGAIGSIKKIGHGLIKIQKHTKHTSTGFDRLTSRIRNLVAAAFVFNVLRRGLSEMKKYFGAVLRSNDDFIRSLNATKVNLLTAFAPIWEVIQPALITFMGIIERITAALAALISMLFGKTYAQAKGSAKALDDQAKALDGIGGAAKKAAANLQGFDEVNTLTGENADDADGGAGGIDWEADTTEGMTVLFDDLQELLKSILELLQPSLEAFQELWGVLKGIGENFAWPALQDFYNEFLVPVGKWFLSDDGLPRLLRIIKDMLNEVNWNSLLDSLKGLWEALSKFNIEVGTALLDFTEKVLKPIGGWIMGEGLPALFDVLSNIMNVIDWPRLHDAFNKLWDVLAPFGTFVGDTIINFLRDFVEPVAIWSVTEGLERFLDITTGLFNSIDWEYLTQVFDELFQALAQFSVEIGRGLLDFYEYALVPLAKWTIGTALPEFVEGLTKILTSVDWEGIRVHLINVYDAIAQFVGTIGDGLLWFYENVLVKLAVWVGNDLLPVFFDALAASIDVANGVIEALKPLGLWLWENFLQPVAEWSGGIIVSVLDGIVSALKSLSDWVYDNKSTIEGITITIGAFFAVWETVKLISLIGSIVSALATFITMGGIAATVSGVLSTALGILGGAFALLTSPFTLIGAAIAGLIALFIGLYNNVEGFKDFVDKVVEVGKDLILGLLRGIINVLATIGNWLKENVFNPIINGVKKLFGIHSPSTVMIELGEFIMEGLLKGIESLVDDVIDFFVGIWEGIQKIFQNVGKWFSDRWGDIKAAFSVTGKWFKETFQTAWDNIVNIWDAAADWFAGVWDGIKKAFDKAAEWFKDTFSTAWENIKTAWDKVIEWFGDIWTGIKTAFEKTVEWFSETFQKAWTAITEIWDAVIDWFSDVWDGIIDIFIGSSDWFRGVFQDAWDSITGIWTGATEWFGGIWSGIQGAFSSVTEWFRTTFTDAWQAVKNVFSTGGAIFVGITDGILDSFRTIVNGIIGGINNVLIIPFEGINNMINKIRDVDIFGFKPFNGIGAIGVPQIPLLEKGGVLEKGQIGLLEGTGAEAVVPLEQNTGWISKVAAEMIDAVESFSLPAVFTSSIIERGSRQASQSLLSKEDIADLANAIGQVIAVNAAVENDRGGTQDRPSRIYIDGKEVGEAIFDSLIDIGNRRGIPFTPNLAL